MKNFYKNFALDYAAVCDACSMQYVWCGRPCCDSIYWINYTIGWMAGQGQKNRPDVLPSGRSVGRSVGYLFPAVSRFASNVAKSGCANVCPPPVVTAFKPAFVASANMVA